MFQINDIVIHKTAGTCIVTDIVDKNFGVGVSKYYYLRPRFPTVNNKTLEIFLPLDKENDYLRLPLSRNEVKDLIEQFPIFEKVWISDAKKRKLMFEQIYKSGDIVGLCKLTKLLYYSPESFDRPISPLDRDFLNKIKTHVLEEFAIVLDVSIEQVEDYIHTVLDKQ